MTSKSTNIWIYIAAALLLIKLTSVVVDHFRGDTFADEVSRVKDDCFFDYDNNNDLGGIICEVNGCLGLSEPQKTNCLFHISIVKKDSAMCNYIQDKLIRDSCIKAITSN